VVGELLKELEFEFSKSVEELLRSFALAPKTLIAADLESLITYGLPVIFSIFSLTVLRDGSV
jgi:hypothetical protein